MSRARTKKYMQTAAAPEKASGCFGLMLPPMAVLIVSAFLATIALNRPVDVHSADSPPLSSNISTLFTPEIQYWSDSISRWAAGSHLDPNLVAVIMQIESCGNPRARSHAGAMGLFQVMPSHFYIADNPYDPDTNATRGLAYLVKALKIAGGDIRLSLAGYNGGVGLIGLAEWTWPAETKRYVHYGWPIYEDAQNSSTSSSILNEWYNRFGTGLCRQARQQIGIP